jgi:uncharacterized protein YbdZ (MbtH family)
LWKFRLAVTISLDQHQSTTRLFYEGLDQQLILEVVRMTSLWPALADVPAGRRVVYGEPDRAACLDYIEQTWADIRPKSLRDRLAASRASGS